MRINRYFVHFLVLLALPLVVVWFNLGLAATTLLVLLWLASRWVLTLQRFTATQHPELVLETISASHFVEKVRWCLDRLGLDYIERPTAGTLGAFFAGRTVPKLWVRTGTVQSAIGNSSEILRYLWGRYAHACPEKAQFLEPTPERTALEKRLDKYGHDLQIWIYYHGLPNRRFILHAWGVHDQRLPALQRFIIWLLFPVLKVMMMRAFRISERSAARSTERIGQLLEVMNERLAESDCLVDGGRSYVDYAFAGMSGLWLQPAQFANGQADGVRIERADWPPATLECIKTWTGKYPHAVAFVTHLYATERC